MEGNRQADPHISGRRNDNHSSGFVDPGPRSEKMKKRTQASLFRRNGTVRFAIFPYLIGFTTLFAAPQLAHFEDVTARAHINFRNEASHTSRKYLPETMGGGVAMFDYNRDG